MPYRVFDIDEVAGYLHLTKEEVETLVKNQEIPFEKRGSRLVFRRVDVDAWASQRILEMESAPLATYHGKTTNAAADILAAHALMPELVVPRFIDPQLPARTRVSAIREMVALAGKTGRVGDESALLESIQAREELCSTGLPGGLALLHPRNPDASIIDSAFVVVGRAVHPVPFGAPDRQPTDLFFLLGCPDDRLHLHTLARICMMTQKTDLLAQLRSAGSAGEMHDVIVAAENEVLPGVT